MLFSPAAKRREIIWTFFPAASRRGVVFAVIFHSKKGLRLLILQETKT
jgi:hypothetical protein